MSAAATAAGYLYLAGMLGKRQRRGPESLAERHGPTVARALQERAQPKIVYKKKRLP